MYFCSPGPEETGVTTHLGFVMVYQKGAKRVPPDKGDVQDMNTSPYQALELGSLQEASFQK